MDQAERREVLKRYLDHARRFEEAAQRRGSGSGSDAEVVPLRPPPADELQQQPTARQIEVLEHLAEGLVNREIAERLFLSEETVKSHVRHLLAKLQARSRAHAVAIAFRRKLVD